MLSRSGARLGLYLARARACAAPARSSSRDTSEIKSTRRCVWGVGGGGHLNLSWPAHQGVCANHHLSWRVGLHHEPASGVGAPMSVPSAAASAVKPTLTSSCASHLPAASRATAGVTPFTAQSLMQAWSISQAHGRKHPVTESATTLHIVVAYASWQVFSKTCMHASRPAHLRVVSSFLSTAVKVGLRSSSGRHERSASRALHAQARTRTTSDPTHQAASRRLQRACSCPLVAP